MKNISIFLMKIHRFYYLLLGALIGLIVFSQVQNVQKMIPTADINPLIPIFFIFGIGYIQFLAMAVFYTEEERVTNEISGNIKTFGGYILWDKYFASKIHTELSLFKQLCGYVYVILSRVFHFTSGYFLVAIVCLLSNK